VDYREEIGFLRGAVLVQPCVRLHSFHEQYRGILTILTVSDDDGCGGGEFGEVGQEWTKRSLVCLIRHCHQSLPRHFQGFVGGEDQCDCNEILVKVLLMDRGEGADSTIEDMSQKR
jgi:hypothetical protein